MTNAQKLRELKKTYGITTKQVAKILGLAIITVNRWLLDKNSPHFEFMPDSRLDHLKSKLSRRRKVNQSL